MIKNFDWSLKNLNDAVLEEVDGIPLTAKVVACNALLAQDSQETTGDKKASRYSLAIRIHAGGDVELKPEEISTIKEQVGKIFPPIVVGPMYKFLDS